MKNLIAFFTCFCITLFLISCNNDTNPLTSTNGSNRAPSVPTSPVPANNDSLYALTHVTFQWACSDPDEGDTLKYDLYLNQGSTATTLLAGDLTQSVYDFGIPGHGQWTWRVVAKDQHGATSGATFRFFMKLP